MEATAREALHAFRKAYLEFYSSRQLRDAPFEDALAQWEAFHAEWILRLERHHDLVLEARRRTSAGMLRWHYRKERPPEEFHPFFRAREELGWASLGERVVETGLYASYCLRWNWLDEAEIKLRSVCAIVIEAVIAESDPQASYMLMRVEEQLAVVGVARYRPVTRARLAGLEEALRKVCATRSGEDEEESLRAVENAAALAEDLWEQYRDALFVPRDVVRLYTGFLARMAAGAANSLPGDEGDAWKRLLRAMKIMG